MYTRYEFILYTESIPIYKPKQEKQKKNGFFYFSFVNQNLLVNNTNSLESINVLKINSRYFFINENARIAFQLSRFSLIINEKRLCLPTV